MILTAVMFYLHSASEGDAEHDIAMGFLYVHPSHTGIVLKCLYRVTWFSQNYSPQLFYFLRVKYV